jgi:hypothetical protein
MDVSLHSRPFPPWSAEAGEQVSACLFAAATRSRVFDDDTEVPIEVEYQGLNKEGEHLWLQVSPEPLPRSKLRSYHMDKLPENTVIRFVINELA